MYKIFTLAAMIAATPFSISSEMDIGKKVQFENPVFFQYKNILPHNFWEPEKQPVEAWNENWAISAQENIRKSEYHFKWEEKYKAYCTPNRKNNLRFFYDDKGFSVEPRTTKIPIGEFDPVKMPDELKYRSIPNWKIIFNFDKKQIGKGVWKVSQNEAEYITQNITVQYINSKEGMRQNFIVSSPLSKQDEVKINFSIKTKLKTLVSKDQLQFFHKKVHVLNYEKLKVWDANGRSLQASIKKNNTNKYHILVNTKNAIYPITIDPLSTTPDSSPDDANQGDAHFGISVASAGDVNGDGYSDVIIGASEYDDGSNAGEGRAFVYHGSATGLSSLPDNTPDDADQPLAHFGISVASAGDVNGDSFSDVIIGANSYIDGANASEGRAFVYYGSATGLSNTPNSTPDDADQANCQFGYSVACAGDVNGDGYSDVIIGARSYTDGANGQEGRAFVYHGSAAGLSASPNSTPDDANQAGAIFGESVSSAGDVNGDGYSDVIIGAFLYDDGFTDEGKAFVYHGSATGLSASPNSTPDDANQANVLFGIFVSTAGDVNGDGYSDVIIGGPQYDDGANTNEGRAFVYYGSATGISAIPDNTPDDADKVGANFGQAVSCAGDVNGDGYGDVIIGAFAYTDGANSAEGRAFVYHGSATGLSSTPNSTPDDADQAGAFFGYSVASAGDVNGDGYSDVIIGAYLYDDGLTGDEGRAFVYHGSAAGINTNASATVESNQASARMGYSVASAGDVNGDGYSDVIVGVGGYDNGQTDEGAAFIYHGSAAGISTTIAAMLESDQVNAAMTFVASAGDVNGDGYSDVIVGVIRYDNTQTDEGAAFVYHGSATGINTTPAAILVNNQPSAFMGWSVASAGDVNGDGYSDVIVGARFYSNGQTGEGGAFVYHGSAAGIITTAAATVESNQANAEMGTSVASAGDVNGDGYSDVIVGAYNYDNGQADEGAAWVYHGSATGISTTAAAMVEGNQAGAYMGISVASAGDVNGDGYSDVIVGACQYDSGEGAVFVYHGSAAGINTTAAALLENNLNNSEMGHSVGPAGDVNGDGYSDVIVGSYTYSNGLTWEGAFYVYHGSVAGINSVAAAMVESNQAFAQMGVSVASAGDVNGDGYSDVIVGAYQYDNGQTDEGAASIYMGNSPGNNKRNNLRLYNTDLSTPINSSNFILGNFGTGLYAKSFLGKTKGKMVWETRLNYNPYSGTPITNSTFFTSQQSAYTDLGITGVELKDLITKLLGGRYTKLRARIKYDPVTAITGQVYSPWRNVSSIIDANKLGVLPLELISFNAAWLQKGKTAKLEFKTDKESGICCFDVEKSTDGFNFYTIGSLPAKNVSGIQSYSFIDDHANNKKQFYRLKIKDITGQIDYSNIQQLQNNDATEILVFPNPTIDVLQLLLNNNYTKMNVQIINSRGQVIKQFNNVVVTNQTLSIPVKFLFAGNYWLCLQNGNEKQVLQFVKQ